MQLLMKLTITGRILKRHWQGICFCISLLFSCLLCASTSHAQPDTSSQFNIEQFKKQQLAFSAKTGSRFLQPDPWQCDDSTTLNTDGIKRPFVLFLGYYGCTPCRVLMKSLDEVLQDHTYDDVSFIYMTFDGSATVHEELDHYRNLRHLRRVLVTGEYITKHDLAMGFPTVYFVKQDHTIAYLETGGASENGAAVDQWWRQHLNALQ